MRWPRLCALILLSAAAFSGCGGWTKPKPGIEKTEEADRKKKEFDPDKIQFDVRLKRFYSKKYKRWFYVYEEYKGIPKQGHSRPPRSTVRFTDYIPDLGTIRKHCGKIGENYWEARIRVKSILKRTVEVQAEPLADSREIQLKTPSEQRAYASRMNRFGQRMQRDYKELEAYLRAISDRATLMVEVDNNERKVTSWAQENGAAGDGGGEPAGEAKADTVEIEKAGPRGAEFTRYVHMLQQNAKRAWIAAAMRSPKALKTTFQKLSLSCIRCHADPAFGSPNPDKRRTVENLPLTTDLE